MKEKYLNCSCGGGASVKIPEEDTSAVTECACGKVLFWSEETGTEVREREVQKLEEI